MKSWFGRPAPPRRRSAAPAVRATEALADQVVSTGATLGTYARDPIDGDFGYRLASKGHREVPFWTREKARDYSVAAYRSNPMATAIVDTYSAFCVGDSGVKWQATNPKVGEVVREFWEDPANRVGHIQEIALRSQLIIGEKLYEMLEGATSGVVRFAPIEPSLIKDVLCRDGNPMWPGKVILPAKDDESDDRVWDAVAVNDETGLREGKAMLWAPWKTLDTDVRGMPFMMPILDWLDSYDTVLSNLIDRTALMRHLAYSVTVEGDQSDIDAYVQARGGIHVPPSGTIEVHNESVKWQSISAQTGAMEDTVANQSVLTMIASGTGLAKAQPLDCKVLTPSGWRLMGDLAVGDEVMTPKGKPARVLKIYPQGEVESFCITFSDGAQTRATWDHLWFTQDVLERRYGQPGSVKTTADIATTLKRGVRWNHHVPLVDPIDGEDGLLPIDPYVLGVLLGDGHVRTKSDGAVEILLSSADPELIADVNDRVDGYFKHSSAYDYRYIEPSKASSLRRAMRELGVCDAKSHTKTIPPVYLTASTKSRLALLQGLLDTDGGPSHGTSAVFTTVSATLADQVRELSWSLGGVCTIRTFVPTYVKNGAKVSGRTAYQLRITLPAGERYFRLARKHDQTRAEGQKLGRAVRTVRSVEPAGAIECQCILIDDPEHLYVTDDYVVTHNTWLAEPDGANRATSLSMAEPVRRRVGAVQNTWLYQMTELCRFVVDRAVAAGRLPATVDSKDPKTGDVTQIPASQAVCVTGPEIAAADATINAQVLLNLSTGLEKLVQIGALSRESAQVAAQKAWEDYVGVPFSAELGQPDAPVDDIATEVEKAAESHLRVVGGRSK